MKSSLRAALFFCAVLPFPALAETPVAPSLRPLGVFEEQGDIGNVQIPGKAVYDNQEQLYTVEGSGTNMWIDHDEFHFVWRKITGNFILQTRAELVGPGTDPHRKVGIIVRASLDPRSPHVNVCRHGDGLTSFQFRRTEGAPTEEVRFDLTGPDVLQLSRQGGTYTMSVARAGETYTSKSLTDVSLGDTVYVGIYICAHHNDVSEKGIFRNVKLIRPAPDNFVAYHDYIGSDVEVMDVSSGHRTTIYHEDDSIQAPNWATDNKHLVMNHNGRMVNFDLRSHVLQPLDTADKIRCNNDHALSFNGRQLGISSGEVSTVYILPSKGGKPQQVTTLNPSYLHGWSPDGKFLIFTGIRNGDGDIYRVSVKGGAEEQLTNVKGLDDGSEYTRDGKFIYFNSERTGRMQIWRMKPDGSAQEQVTHDDFNNWFPHPSPDGNWLIFLSYGSEIPASDHPFYKQVYVRKLSLKGGEPTVIAYLYGGQGSMNVNSWSPDSKSIAFVSNTDRL